MVVYCRWTDDRPGRGHAFRGSAAIDSAGVVVMLALAGPRPIEGKIGGQRIVLRGRGTGAGGIGLPRLFARLLAGRLVPHATAAVGPRVDGVDGRAVGGQSRRPQSVIAPIPGADLPGTHVGNISAHSAERPDAAICRAAGRGHCRLAATVAAAATMRPWRLTGAILLLAMWVHLWAGHSSCKRYVFPLVLMSCGFAALGLLRLSAIVARWAGARAGGLSQFSFYENGTVPLRSALFASAILGGISLAVAFSCDCSGRAERICLGHWLRDALPTPRVLVGPDGFTQVVNYYAQGRCASFSPTTDAESVAELTEEMSARTPCCCPKTRQISAATDRWSTAWKRPDSSQSPPS